MEKKYDENFQIVFEAIKQLFDEVEKPKTYGQRPKKLITVSWIDRQLPECNYTV